jgi:hypothetical protein
VPAETVITVLAATLLATGWALWVLPVGTCAQCPHCRIEKLARERENEAQVSRIYGVPFCAVCGRHHRREEDHHV